MLIGGVALGWLASFQAGNLRAGLIASALAAAVLLYDGLLKRTPIGPLGMGACRMLNVLLGMAAGSQLFAPVYEEFSAAHYVLAGGIGLYIVGVTLFARREAQQSSLAALASGSAIMAGGIALVAWYPTWAEEAGMDLAPGIEIRGLPMGLLGALILYRCVMAIVEGGHPLLVQRAVTHCLRSLIVLDAFACAAAAGMVPAVAILCLLVPTLILGWWLYST
jgi:4-hydroxybenzoate polyprenyltransferase